MSRRGHQNVEVITLSDDSSEEDDDMGADPNANIDYNQENNTMTSMFGGGSNRNNYQQQPAQQQLQQHEMMLADLCYRCCMCAKPYTTDNDLEAHLTTDHLQWVPYKCDYCYYVWLPTEHALRAHLALQHPKEPPKMVYVEDDKRKSKLKQLLAQSKAGSMGPNGIPQRVEIPSQNAPSYTAPSQTSYQAAPPAVDRDPPPQKQRRNTSASRQRQTSMVVQQQPQQQHHVSAYIPPPAQEPVGYHRSSTPVSMNYDQEYLPQQQTMQNAPEPRQYERPATRAATRTTRSKPVPLESSVSRKRAAARVNIADEQQAFNDSLLKKKRARTVKASPPPPTPPTPPPQPLPPTVRNLTTSQLQQEVKRQRHTNTTINSGPPAVRVSRQRKAPVLKQEQRMMKEELRVQQQQQAPPPDPAPVKRRYRAAPIPAAPILQEEAKPIAQDIKVVVPKKYKSYKAVEAARQQKQEQEQTEVKHYQQPRVREMSVHIPRTDQRRCAPNTRSQRRSAEEQQQQRAESGDQQQQQSGGCRVCGCYVFDDLERHAFGHLEPTLQCCPFCNKQRLNMRQHIQDCHQDERASKYDRFLDRFGKKLKEQFGKCFPKIAAANAEQEAAVKTSGRGRTNTVAPVADQNRCQICDHVFKNPTSAAAISHVFNHMGDDRDTIRYRCQSAGCPFESAHRAAIVAHCRKRHQDAVCYVDKSAAMKHQFDSTQRRCFPQLATASDDRPSPPSSSKRRRATSKTSDSSSGSPPKKRASKIELSAAEKTHDRSLSVSPELIGERSAKNLAIKRLSNGRTEAEQQRQPTKCYCKVCARDIFASQKAHIYLIHLKKPRFRCSHCDASKSHRREAVVAHIDEVHGGLGRPLDGRDELAKEAGKWATKCFGTIDLDDTLTPSSEGTSPRSSNYEQRIKKIPRDRPCLVCGDTPIDPFYHVQLNHYPKAVFVCSECGFGSVSDRSDVRNHILSVHPDDPYAKVEDRQMELMSDLRRAILECFAVSRTVEEDKLARLTGSERAKNGLRPLTSSARPEVLSDSDDDSVISVGGVSDRLQTDAQQHTPPPATTTTLIELTSTDDDLNVAEGGVKKLLDGAALREDLESEVSDVIEVLITAVCAMRPTSNKNTYRQTESNINHTDVTLDCAAVVESMLFAVDPLSFAPEAMETEPIVAEKVVDPDEVDAEFVLKRTLDTLATAEYLTASVAELPTVEYFYRTEPAVPIRKLQTSLDVVESVSSRVHVATAVKSLISVVSYELDGDDDPIRKMKLEPNLVQMLSSKLPIVYTLQSMITDVAEKIPTAQPTAILETPEVQCMAVQSIDINPKINSQNEIIDQLLTEMTTGIDAEKTADIEIEQEDMMEIDDRIPNLTSANRFGCPNRANLAAFIHGLNDTVEIANSLRSIVNTVCAKEQQSVSPIKTSIRKPLRAVPLFTSLHAELLSVFALRFVVDSVVKEQLLVADKQTDTQLVEAAPKRSDTNESMCDRTDASSSAVSSQEDAVEMMDVQMEDTMPIQNEVQDEENVLTAINAVTDVVVTMNDLLDGCNDPKRFCTATSREMNSNFD